MMNFMTPKQASIYLGYSVHSLQLWRSKGMGPKYIKINDRTIRYEREDLDDWVKKFGTRCNTTQENPTMYRERL